MRERQEGGGSAIRESTFDENDNEYIYSSFNVRCLYNIASKQDCVTKEKL